MKTLTTTIKASIWMLVCTLCTVSCTQEEVWKGGEENYAGKPIQIIVSGPDNHAVSRAAAPKDEFEAGDIIHLSTTFTYVSGTNGTPTVYSCLKWSGKAWEEITNPKTFVWPWNATTAKFEAYYIPAAGTHTNRNPMTTGDIPINITDLAEPTKAGAKWADPLYAGQGSDQAIPAGSSVYLQFNHLLTKITFTHLNKPTNGVSPVAGEELRLIVKEGTASDKITFNLSSANQLTHTMEAATGYIAGKVNSTNEVSFLLPATNAIGSKVKLARKDMSSYHSFSLDKDLFPNGLEAGKHYAINVTLLADNYVSDAVKEEDWNKNTDPVKVDAADIQKYLESIRDGKACFVTDQTTKTSVQVLTINTENDIDVVAQIRDIDFDNKEFTPVNLRSTIIFQGNGHKIQNVKITNTIQDDNYPDVPSPTGTFCKSLFGKNNGTIKNIIIETASFETGVTQEANAGILVSNNIGTIDNVTIKGVTIEGTAAKTMGMIVGTNAGTISKCHVAGDVSIAINKTATDCYVGGLVGSTTGGSITDCSIAAGTAHHAIKMNGTYSMCYVGGLVGNSDRAITNCFTNLDVTINASSVGYLYAGGFIGNQADTEITKGTATGHVSVSSSIAETNPSYIGGFAGYLAGGALTDCAATGNITQAPASSFIGGLVGGVKASSSTAAITYSSATGTITPNSVGGLIGTAIESTGTISIANSFCVNTAKSFIATTPLYVTIKDCHMNGIMVGGTESFIPADAGKWTNKPAIYGNDSKGNAIYYLIRKL